MAGGSAVVKRGLSAPDRMGEGAPRGGCARLQSGRLRASDDPVRRRTGATTPVVTRHDKLSNRETVSWKLMQLQPQRSRFCHRIWRSWFSVALRRSVTEPVQRADAVLKTW